MPYNFLLVQFRPKAPICQKKPQLRGDTGRAIFKEDIEDEAFIDLEVV